MKINTITSPASREALPVEKDKPASNPSGKSIDFSPLAALSQRFAGPASVKDKGALQNIGTRLSNGFTSVTNANALEGLSDAAGGSRKQVAFEVRMAALQLQATNTLPPNSKPSLENLMNEGRAELLLTWAEKIEQGKPASKVSRNAIIKAVIKEAEANDLSRSERDELSTLKYVPLDSETVAQWCGYKTPDAKEKLGLLRSTEKVLGIYRGPVADAITELTELLEKLTPMVAKDFKSERSSLEKGMNPRVLIPVLERAIEQLRAGKPVKVDKGDIARAKNKIHGELELSKEELWEADIVKAFKIGSTAISSHIEKFAGQALDTQVPSLTALRKVEQMTVQNGLPQTHGNAAVARMRAMVRLQGDSAGAAASHTLAVDKSAGVVLNPVVALTPAPYTFGTVQVGPYIEPQVAAEGRRGNAIGLSKNTISQSVEFSTSSGFQVKAGAEVGAGARVSVPGIQLASATVGVNAYASRTSSSGSSVRMTVRYNPVLTDRKQRPASVLSQMIKTMGTQAPGADGESVARAIASAQSKHSDRPKVELAVTSTQGVEYAFDTSIFLQGKIGVPVIPSTFNTGVLANVAHQSATGRRTVTASGIQDDHGVLKAVDTKVTKASYTSSKTEIPIKSSTSTPGFANAVHQASVNSYLGLVIPLHSKTQATVVHEGPAGDSSPSPAPGGEMLTATSDPTATGVPVEITDSQAELAARSSAAESLAATTSHGEVVRPPAAQSNPDKPVRNAPGTAAAPVKESETTTNSVTFSSWSDVKNYCARAGHRIPVPLTDKMKAASGTRSFELIEMTDSLGSKGNVMLRVSDTDVKRRNAWYPFGFVIKFSKVVTNADMRLVSEHRLGFKEIEPSFSLTQRVTSSIGGWFRRTPAASANSLEAQGKPLKELLDRLQRAGKATNYSRPSANESLFKRTQLLDARLGKLPREPRVIPAPASAPGAPVVPQRTVDWMRGSLNKRSDVNLLQIQAALSHLDAAKSESLAALKKAVAQALADRAEQPFTDRFNELLHDIANKRESLGHSPEASTIAFTISELQNAVKELDQTVPSSAGLWRHCKTSSVLDRVKDLSQGPDEKRIHETMEWLYTDELGKMVKSALFEQQDRNAPSRLFPRLHELLHQAHTSVPQAVH